jgi:predicted CXXCH cytochrome family protein
MRRLASLALGALFVLSTAATALGQGQIAGSLHDFRDDAWAGDTGGGDGDFCVVCHTPHTTSSATAPLWNHDLTTETFTMYTSDTFDGGALVAPDGESLVCLGCHDGQTALDSYGGTSGTTTMNDILLSNANSIVGTDLRNDHPVSFSYATSEAADNTLNPSSNANVAALLRSGKVQCASCHDPHGVPGLSSFMRVDNTASALCTRCHNK